MVPDITAQILDHTLYLPVWVRVLLFAGGMTLGISGAAGWVRWRRGLADARLAPGSVTSLRRVEYGEGDGYLPTVSFTTAGGERKEFESSIGSGKSQWKIGDQVWVRTDGPSPDLHAPRLIEAKYLTIVLGGLLIASASLADRVTLG